MTEEESLQLLKARHPSNMEFDRTAASDFAARVGHLPLALSLGASRASQGSTFAEIIEELNETEISIRAIDHDFGRTYRDDADARRLLSLEACFDISVRHLNEDVRGTLLSLAILPDDEHIDANEATLLNKSSDMRLVQRHLQVLETASLVLGTESGPTVLRKWHLHDLIRDYLRSAHIEPRAGKPPFFATVSLNESHGQFVDHCGRLANFCWANAPTYAYVDRRLTWHAEMAGDVEVLDEVISQQRDKRPLWLERLLEKGESALFMGDVRRSIRVAAAMVAEERSRFAGMRQLFRAAIARACVVSKANKIPPPLAVRMVAEGRWPYREAHAKAQLLTGIAKVWTLGRLQTVVPSGERLQLEGEIFAEMLGTTFLIPEETVLESVIPNASAGLRRRILQHAEKANASTHATVLSHVALSEPVHQAEWLAAYAGRRFASSREKKDGYAKLLKVGLVPPATDAMRLFGLLETPLTANDLSFFASLLPLLPEAVADAGVKMLAANGFLSLLLPLASRRSIPLTNEFLCSLRTHAEGSKPTLLAAWMMAVTIDALPDDQQAAALDEALVLIRNTPDSDWRKSLALISASRPLDEPARSALEREAWDLAARNDLSSLGVFNFAELTSSLTIAGQAHATAILKSQSAETRVRGLPSLIGNSSAEFVPDQVLSLADAMRSYGEYGDLDPCIDRIPAAQLSLVYDACTEIKVSQVQLTKSPALAESTASPSPSADGGGVRTFRGSHSEADAFLARFEQHPSSSVSIEECASIIASAGDFDALACARLLEALGWHLREDFSAEEIRELEDVIALTFEVYR